MNHFYKSLWNEITRTYVAVAETARGKGKSSRSRTPAAHPADTRRAPGFGGFRSMALEQRFMFDGAAVAQAIDTTVADPGAHLLQFAASNASAAPDALIAAQAQAERLVNDFLAGGDVRQQMFTLFNGGQSGEPSAAWNAEFDQLMRSLQNGENPVRVELRSAGELQGAKGAFSINGTTGQATIYLNSAWLEGNPAVQIGPADSSAITTVLVEELGHYLDASLNAGGDTAGDEGELFARMLIDGSDPASLAWLSGQNDHATLQIDGQTVQAELAAFNFVNAYEMVYDLNANNSIDVNERWAEKEQNLHYFDGSHALGAVNVIDGTNNQNFSGNDVSVTALVINGTTYYGWISRPIKDQGIVRGFYFWTDDNFNNNGSAAANFAAAQADGNQDGDRNVTDNRGFLLVVDQGWFTTQINNGSQMTISSTKDGNHGAITVASVGSSSDRVDAAINSLIVPNSGPVAANDSLTVGEDSGTTNITAGSGLLSNDSDPNNDTLTVTTFSVGGVSTNAGSTYTIPSVGDIKINADGSYSFTPVPNYNGPVPPITYTVSDGHGGTTTAVLSISVTPVNDAPSATNDVITTAENTSLVLGLNDFGTYSDPEGDPLALIQITQLPGTGTLEFWTGAAWVTVTPNQVLTVAQILQGQVRFTPAANTSGNNYTTLQFKVSDGQLYTANASTLTVHVTAGNQAPVANADTNTVTEAGCGVVAANATGNVLTGGTPDSDPENQMLTVSAVTFDGFTKAVSGATTLKGLYGTLTINTDGSYSYALDNTLAVIDQMNSGATKTETFSYSVTDGTNTSSTNLTLTIRGTNDNPVAADDASTLVKGTNAGTGNFGTVTGNALTNDTDVDNNQVDLKVSLVDGTTPTTTQVAVLDASSPITSVTATASTVAGSPNNWSSTLPSTYVGFEISNDGGQTWTLAKAVNGTNLQVLKLSPSTLQFSDNVALYGYQNSIMRYIQPSPVKETWWSVALSNPVTSTGMTVYTSSSSLGNIQVNDVVTWTGMPANTIVTVTAVDAAAGSITLDTSVTLTNVSLTITRQSVSITATQEYFQGTYGYLILNENGSYTYTLTSDLAAGAAVTENFTYTVKDPGACVDTAVITIRASAADAPQLSNDTLVVNEDSGTHVTFNNNAGNTATDTVNTNDANGSGGVTLGNVASFKVAGDNTTYTAGGTATITGVGTLSIAANGTIAFVPVTGYLGPVPTVTYTRTGSDTNPYTATLTITIQPVDNPSVLVADSQTVPEDTTANGNVLANDSDVDSTLSVASFSYTSNNALVNYATGTTAQEVRDASNVLIGTIVINSNGNYSFVPTANWNGTVPQITYTTNTASSSTLDITVTPLNDPPTLDLDGNDSSTVVGTGFKTSYTNAGTAVSIGDVDVQVSDVDSANIASAVIVLTNPQSGDTLNVDATALLANYGITATTSSAGGVITVSLSGSSSLANYQAAIQAITFSSTGNTTVDRVVSVKVNDGTADSNTAYTTISVSADIRLVTVMGTVVNEASPYVAFEVTGVANQWITLQLGQTSNANGNATMGTDFLPNLQYFDGTNWQNYTGGLIQIPSTMGGKLLARTGVLQDAIFETTNAGYETLKLTAKNAAGTANVTTDVNNMQADGTAQIRDDGQGSIYLGNNNTFTANVPNDTDPNGPDYPAYLDDDRPVQVNNIAVNEGSPKAVFTLTGSSGQVLSLALHDGTATAGPGTDGTQDYGTNLEYWNGTAWTAYNGTSVTLTGTSLLVRTSILQDNLFEGQHSFSLGVTKLSSNTTVYGICDIYDDGTGPKYPDQAPTNATTPATDNTNLDDDRTLSINSLTVNEGSDFVVFTLTGNSGQTASLQLVDESNNGTVLGKANIDETQVLKVWNGLDWVDYNASNLPTFDANGKIFVRVDIIAEQDLPYEGAETFKLTATLSGSSTTATGTATIIDDGTGVKYPGTFTNGVPDTNTTSLDNDLVDVLPIATNDTATYTPGVTKAVDVLANDTTGDTVVATTVKITTAGAAGDGKSLTVAGEGTWSVNATTGVITFTPGNGFTGNPTPITYSVADAQNNLTSATVTLTAVNQAPPDVLPIAADDTATYVPGTSASIAVLANDTAGDAVLPSTLRFSGNNGTSLNVPGEGTWTIDTTSGVITFTPATGFTGSPTPVGYKVADAQGNYTTATVTLTADPLPEATDDSATYIPGSPVSIQVLTNDNGGDSVLPATLQFANGGTSLTVPNEGTWTINTTTGVITFSPEPGFSSNPTPVAYTVADAQGNRVAATVRLTAEVPLQPVTVPVVVPADPPAPGTPQVGGAEPSSTAPATQSFTSLPPSAPVQSFSYSSSSTDRSMATPSSSVADQNNAALTSFRGFPVTVIPTTDAAAQPRLMVFNGITNQYVEPHQVSRFTLPYDAFSHTRSDAVITLTAQLSTGAPLPNWLHFDSRSGTFQAEPPQRYRGDLHIVVIATDGQREARAQFKFSVGEFENRTAPKPAGRPSLSDKLQSSARDAGPMNFALPQGRQPADQRATPPAARPTR